MSDDEQETIAYISQAHREAPVFLCVADIERGAYHMFPLSYRNASRLAYECSGVVHARLAGLSDKFTMQEIAEHLSKLEQMVQE